MFGKISHSSVRVLVHCLVWIRTALHQHHMLFVLCKASSGMSQLVKGKKEVTQTMMEKLRLFINKMSVKLQTKNTCVKIDQSN